MVSSFDPHNMCAKVERITAKTGCTSCAKWTISFKVWGFQTKTRLFQRRIIFLNLFQLKTFCASNMQHSKPHTKFQPFSSSIEYKFSGYNPTVHLKCIKAPRKVIILIKKLKSIAISVYVFHFSKPFSTQEFFCIQHATFKATY